MTKTLAKIRKALVSVATGLGIIITQAAAEGEPTHWTATNWVTAALAVLTALGVYQVPNSQPTDNNI